MSTSASESTIGQEYRNALRYWLGGRRGLVAAAVAAAGAGLWFGWPTLVAAGLAPLVLAMAPCAAMCALGLCMNRGAKKAEAGSHSPDALTGSTLQRGRSPAGQSGAIRKGLTNAKLPHQEPPVPSIWDRIRSWF